MIMVLGLVGIALVSAGLGLLTQAASYAVAGSILCLTLGTFFSVMALTFWFEPDDLP